jgi:hypothetical protein
MRTAKVELVPQFKSRAKPVFATADDYEQFRSEWRKAITPELERQAEARRKSWERAAWSVVA